LFSAYLARSACALAVAFAALSISSAPAAADESGVTRAVLPDGLRVVIVRDTLAPVVTTEVNYLAGANQSPEGFPGMAHAQEHMMFRGSPQLSADQLAAISASMGGDFDADTQATVTQFFFTVPAEDLSVALHVEAARMHDVDDSQSQWLEERGPIEQEVAADASDPIRKVFTTVNAALYAGTPYAVDGVGTRPSFDKTTGAMIHDFYEKWYGPNDAILVIAGDVDPASTLAEVKSLFGTIPSRPTPPRPPVALAPLKPTTITSDSDLPVPVCIVGYRMPGSDSPDFAAAQVLAGVLESQRANLYALVPQGTAVETFFFADGEPGVGEGLALAALKPGVDASGAVTTIKNIIAGYAQNGVPADLVAAAQRQALAQAEAKLNSISGLADAWSESLSVEDRTDPDADIRAMQKVTVADVDRVAREYLDNSTAVVGILNPKPTGAAPSHSNFGGPEAFAPTGVKAVTLPQWASAAVNSLAIPPLTVNPVASVLPNGIRLIVQRETVSRTVQVIGSIKDQPALQEPRGQEGVSGVVDDLFAFGTQHLDRLSFQKALDDIAASESAGSNFSLSVLAPNFDRGVQLLADNELHPYTDDKIFSTVRDRDAATVAGELTSPDYLYHRAISLGLLPSSDPTLREATLQSVSSLTLADALSYYHRAFRPDETTIVVIGDVTPAQARTSIERWFGSWKASGSKPDLDLAKVPLNRPSVSHVPDASRVQDNVDLEENIGLVRSDSDYYTLQVANHVLGGGFYATRLYHDLREKAGLVYTIGNTLQVGKTRSTFDVEYGCDPQNVSRAKALVVRDLKDMQTSLVTPAELQQAKALLLREIPLGEADEGAIAGGLMAESQADLPLDEPLRAARIYVGITAEQVRAAFAKWIRPDAFVEAIEGPRPQ
jgi:zinc protease